MRRRTWKYKVKQLGRLSAHEFEGMAVAPAITKDETAAMVAYHIRIPPRTRIPHSYHKKAHEIIVVLDGRGTAHLDRSRVALRKGRVLLVQPRTWHSFSTAASPLEFIAVAAPRVDAKTDLYYT
ncbi:MAG: cupin domain-containing protein [Elusimicrobia bacterium]|nr:cupin domain-containing protein [Elusimicrobiota bacterium]